MLIDELEFCEYLKKICSGKSVAVVGNSPILLEYKNGDYIDSHDVVIRFNTAELNGLEIHTGQKTTLRFVLLQMQEEHESFFDHLKEDSIIITKPINQDKLANKNDLIVLKFSIHGIAFTIIDNILGTNYSQQSLKPVRSGLAVLLYLIAPEIGIKKISVFGMERFPRQDGEMHFYKDNKEWEQLTKTYDNFHLPLTTEIEIFNQILERMDLITYEPKINSDSNTDTFQINVTKINNKNLSNLLTACWLDYPKQNQQLITQQNTSKESIIVAGWVLPKQDDVTIKIIAKTSDYEKEGILSIERPDVVKKKLNINPLNSPFTKCGFNFEIEFSKKIELFISINEVSHHWLTIEMLPRESTQIRAIKAWHNFIDNRIEKISLNDAKELQKLEPNLIAKHLYKKPIIVKNDLKKALNSPCFKEKEKDFLKSFFAQISKNDFCADLVESALNNDLCSIVNPFGLGSAICNQSFQVLTNITALRFICPSGETFFIFQWITSADAIYFPCRDFIFRNHHICDQQIYQFMVNLCGHFTFVLDYIIKSSRNKFAGILASSHRPYHFYYDVCLGVYFLFKKNLITKIPAIYLYQGEDFFSIKTIFDASCDEYIKNPAFIRNNCENKNLFYLHIGSNGGDQNNIIFHEEISDLILTKADQLVSPEILLEVKMAQECYPLLWFGITGQKRTWREQVEGGAKIITELAKMYPHLGVVFDGWTSPLHPLAQDIVEITKDKAVVNKIIELLPKDARTFNLVGADAIRKLALATIIDVFIANNSTGSMYVDRFARKPGVAHIGRSFLKGSDTQIHYQRRTVPSEHIVDIPNPKNKSGSHTSYSIAPDVILNMIKEILDKNNQNNN